MCPQMTAITLKPMMPPMRLTTARTFMLGCAPAYTCGLPYGACPFDCCDWWMLISRPGMLRWRSRSY
ncbi:hypothetical protein ACFPRL_24840 [Pseudoclavibacter helvolus]